MTAPEFSRLIPLARLGEGAVREAIAANPAEREALARRFQLISLDHLAAVAELSRGKGGLVILEARYEAAFVQSCVLSLEPVAGKISDRFALYYGRAEKQGGALTLDAEEEVFEPLSGEAIDIGEAVAQELSLALPAFPRSSEAAFEEKTPDEPAFSPFAVLKRLRPSGKS